MTSEKTSSDVLIIGGGIIGMSIAYQLAKEGLRVTILEKGICGQEASWAGAGVLQCGSWNRHGPLADLLRESLRGYETFTTELNERTGIDPQYIRCGSFDLLTNDQHYRMAVSEVEAVRPYREAYQSNILEMLTPIQARELEPNITPDLLGVKFSSITCQVRNPLLMQALRAVCLLESVNIVEQCEVREILRDGGKVSGVETARGRYLSDHVVLAAGAWSSLVSPDLAQWTPVYPVRGQIILLETPERPFTHIVERGKCYMVPRLDGRTLIGATEEHEAGYDKSNTAEGVNQLLTLAQQLVPALAEARIVRLWAGLRPGTPDRGPYLGPIAEIKGLWAATGHFRSGLILAPITARIIADLIVHGHTPYDLSRYSPGRATEPSSSPGKQAHLT